MKSSWLLSIITFVILFAGVQFAHADLRVLTGPQGGTNLGTATTTDIGKALIVSSTNPLIWTLGTAGSGSTTSSPFIPCSYWATSTVATSFGEVCFESQINSSTPYVSLTRNPFFASFTGLNTPTNYETSTFYTAGPPVSGSGVITQNTNPSDCDGQAQCAQFDLVTPDAGNTFITAISQAFAYNQTKAYTASLVLKNAFGANNSFALAWCDMPVNSTTIFGSDLQCWQPGIQAFGHSGNPGDYLILDPSTSTAYHTFDIAASSTTHITGPASSTIYFNAFFLTPDEVATATLFTSYIKSVSFGPVATSVTTGTNQWVFTSPSTSFPINFKGAQVTADHGVSTTDIIATNAFFNTATTTQLVVLGNAFSGGILGSIDASGTIDYFEPTSLGPWHSTPFLNGYYLINNKTACVGITGSLCDNFSDGVVASDGSFIGHLTIGPLDALGQNQALTVSANNNNGSIWATSAANINSSTPDEIGAHDEGCRLTYIAGLAAFRVGCVSDTRWDYANQGFGSFAAGLDTKATATGSVAFNTSSLATGESSFAAVGGQASAKEAVAIGQHSIVSGVGALAFGHETSAVGDAAIAMGQFAQANGRFCFALFGLCYSESSAGIMGGTASNTNAIAIGGGSLADGQGALALLGSHVSGIGSLGVGGMLVTGDSSQGFGGGILSGNASRSFGSNIDVSGNFSSAFSIGAFGLADAIATSSYTFSILGDSINQSHTFIGGATSSPAANTLVTIDAANTLNPYALAVLNGNVGIGTTTPGFALTVAGDVQVTGTIHNGYTSTTAASTFVPGPTEFNEVNGMTTINCISTVGRFPGDKLILQTNDAVTIKDSQSCSAGSQSIHNTGSTDVSTGIGMNVSYILSSGIGWRMTGQNAF